MTKPSLLKCKKCYCLVHDDGHSMVFLQKYHVTDGSVTHTDDMSEALRFDYEDSARCYSDGFKKYC